MTRLRAVRYFWVLLMLALAPSWAWAEGFGFRAPASTSDPDLPAVMRDLAERMLPVYQELEPERYLANLSALQLAVGDYPAAYDTRRSLRERRRVQNAGRPVDKAIIYDLYVKAKAIQARDRIGFAQAFRQAFGEIIPRLSSRDLQTVAAWLETPQPGFRDALQKSLDRLQAKDTITLDEALDLVWVYVAFDAYRSFGPLVDALVADEDSRRYVVDDDVVIRTAAGNRIHAIVIRPTDASKPLPALLEFTIYDSKGEAKAAAAHDYVGVVAYTRGRKEAGLGRSRGKVLPFQYDGEDARAVIAWITQQPWSDGRVGMMGDGYAGFAAWAAAMRLPSALKAIATYSPMAPGIDFPMSGNIFHNSAYRWAEINTQAFGQPDKGDDDARWREFDRAWYKSGKRYRALEHFPGKPERRVRDIVRNWLTHPSYDRYWQKKIPFGKQFAAIDIPVLTTTGYYAAGEVGALYYFTQHHLLDTDANHTLLIGPYEDRGSAAALQVNTVDPARLVDLRELRYEWFDHVLKAGPRPEVLKDRVNYQVMGSNEWRHVPSLEAMGDGRMRFYLDAGAASDRHRLVQNKASEDAFVTQTINLVDRSDVDASSPAGLVLKSLPVRHGVVFASEPLQQATEFSGLLKGEFDFTPNKMDLDLSITLYEQLAGGSYVQLSKPYEFRASYLQDRIHRHLLQAGVRQRLPFTSERLTSRRFAPGSRLVMVLAVNKRPDQEINYGSGKDVSEESIADAASPLKVRWYGGSYIELPVRK